MDKTLQERRLESIFSATLLGMAALWLMLFLCGRNSTMSLLFYNQLSDLWADFFNPLRYVSGRDVYFNETNGLGEKEYLPLVYMLFYPFSRLEEYGTMTLQDCWHSNLSLISCNLYLLINVFLLFHSLQALCKRYAVNGNVIFALFCSNIMLFSMERANIVFLSAAALNYFLAFHDAADKKLRIFASVALAVSATVKIFPVLFIVLYIPRKMTKEFCVTVAAGLLLAFLPFLFFKHGFANIPQLFRQVTASNKAGVVNGYGGVLSMIVRRLAQGFFSQPITVRLMYAARGFVAAAALLSLGLFFFRRGSLTRWQELELLLFAFLYLPGTNRSYVGLYLFPLVIVFFASQKERPAMENAMLAGLMLIAFSPLEFLRPGQNLTLHKFIFLAIGIYGIAVRIRELAKERRGAGRQAEQLPGRKDTL